MGRILTAKTAKRIGWMICAWILFAGHAAVAAYAVDVAHEGEAK